MATIYAVATSVHVWLGPAFDGHEQLFETLSTCVCSVESSRHPENLTVDFKDVANVSSITSKLDLVRFETFIARLWWQRL